MIKIVLSIIIGIFILGSIALSGLAVLFLLKEFSISLTLIIVLNIFYILFSIVWYILLLRNEKIPEFQVVDIEKDFDTGL